MTKATTKLPPPFDYGAWVTEQAARIEAAVRASAEAFRLSAWVVPSSRVPRGEPGYLHVGTEPPFLGADIVRLGPHGSNLARCPYFHIRSLLWHAARSYPVLPILAEWNTTPRF
jgi:hypothetical protein